MKSFENIVGHERIIAHFEEAIRDQKISHAYLLSGEEGSGKMTLAKDFAKGLLCEKHEGCGECVSCEQVDSGNHPDIIYVTHEKYEIRVDEIRDMVNQTIQIKPYSSEYKIYIIDDAERMNTGAQNALLKTLEEPPEYAIIILLANNRDGLLDTILSRCVSMSLGTVSQEEMEPYLRERTKASDQEISFAMSFSFGNVGKALHILETKEFSDMVEESVHLLTHISEMEIYEVISYLSSLKAYQDEIFDFLDVLTAWYRDMMILKTTGSLDYLIFKKYYRQLKNQEIYLSFEGINHIYDEIMKARKRLLANVKFEVTMEMLLLTIKENGRI